MKFERIYLEKEGEGAYLDAYLADPTSHFTRKGILVIPGGGYSCVCSDREGEPIAHAFLARGYQAFVLHYSVGEGTVYPTQLIEASLAMLHIRRNAEKYGIQREAVFCVGFSAGGHLAATLATMWHREEVMKGLPQDTKRGENRPMGAMLIYPVITPEYHCLSFKNLLCERVSEQEMLDHVNAALAVDTESAPAFFLHTANDPVVDVRNSLSMAAAYRRAEIPFEMHIYPDGPHGMSLSNEITAIGNPKLVNKAIARWVEDGILWAETLAGEGAEK